MTIPRSDELLFAAGGEVWQKYGTLYKRTLPEEESPVTFSRASDATFTDRSGNLRTAESGVVRSHFDAGESSYAVRLEASRTNSLTRSEEFDHADWTTSGVTVTADDAVAPDGTTTADKVEDASTGFDHVKQSQSVPDDNLHRCASVFVNKKSTFDVTCEVQLQYRGGTNELFYIVQLNPATGETATRGNDTPTRYGVEDVGDSWRLWVVGPNDNTGNTTVGVVVAPAANTSGADGTSDASATGFQHVWGAQLEDGAFPSSYVATTTAAVTRSADSLSFDISGTPLATPQEMTVYCKWVERGTLHTFNRLCSIGHVNPRLEVAGADGGYFARHRDSNVNDSQINGMLLGVSIGDVVELRLTLNSDGSIEASSSINGDPVVDEGSGSGASLEGSWSSDTVEINQRDNSTQGFNDFLALTIAPGVKTMSEMRSLEI